MWRYLDPDSFAAVGHLEAKARSRARARPGRRETRYPADRLQVAESVLHRLREDDRGDALTPWLPDALEARRRRQAALRRAARERTRLNARS